jgi:hypothetical protein
MNKIFVRNALIVGIIAILLGTIIFSPANHVNADSLSKPNWKEGDYWGYSLKEYANETEDSEKTKMPDIAVLQEVVGNSTLTIDNLTYEVIIVKMIEYTISSCIVNGEKDEKKNDTHIYELCNFTVLFYRQKSNLAIVKTRFNWDIVPSWEPSWQNWTNEQVYRPPLNDFSFPLKIGKEWQSCSNMTETMTITGTNHTSTIRFCYRFRCLGKTDVETDIGIFPSYIIKSWMGEPEGEPFMYEISYYSPLAGNIVKKEEYQEDHICEVQILKAFSYQGRTRGEKENDMPAFEFSFFITAIVAIILFSRKRKLGGENATG